MSQYDLDILKYRIESISFEKLAAHYWNRYGIMRTHLRKLIGDMGVTLTEEGDPELFFVVRQTDYNDLKAGLNRKRERRDQEEVEPTLPELFGFSPSIALTRDMAKHRFEVIVQNHNAREE